MNESTLTLRDLTPDEVAELYARRLARMSQLRRQFARELNERGHVFLMACIAGAYYTLYDVGREALARRALFDGQTLP